MGNAASLNDNFNSKISKLESMDINFSRPYFRTSTNNKCSACQTGFNILSLKRRKCVQCLEHYCVECVTHYKESIYICYRCQIFISPKLNWKELMSLKIKDLVWFLDRKNISHPHCTDKEQLADIILEQFTIGHDQTENDIHRQRLTINMEKLLSSEQGPCTSSDMIVEECVILSCNTHAYNDPNISSNNDHNISSSDDPNISSSNDPNISSNNDPNISLTDVTNIPLTNVPNIPLISVQSLSPTNVPSIPSTIEDTNICVVSSSMSIPPPPSYDKALEGGYPLCLPEKKCQRVNVEEIVSLNAIEDLSIKQLKDLLAYNKVDYKGCVERHELITRVHRLWLAYNDDREQLGQVNPEMKECIICMDQPVDCVLLECGHMLSCVRCSSRLAECPLCRQNIVRCIRVFTAH